VRIIAGKYRGRVLQLPRNLPVRPTTDFAKEALFNILTNRINLEEMQVLDLFAGTGNLSIELLSRGVKQCTSVDMNYNCTAWLSSAKKTLEIENWKIQKADALKFTKRCTESFNFIIADLTRPW
jgi:16S rRNA (guanine966-N2)-methyltransferase